MKKNHSIKVVKEWFLYGLFIGDSYILVKRTFRNGECKVIVMNSEGKKQEFPACFFDVNDL